MRITKEFDERKQEIIDKSSQLFSRKGYNKTSVADIVREVEVAKGTFYYYFKSKEDVLDALIDQQIESICVYAQTIADDKSLGANEKLFKIILGNNKESSENKMDGDELIETLHLEDNEKSHVKSMKVSIVRLAPIIAQVVEEGIEEGIFNTPYPLVTVELLLASSFLFDDGIFQWQPEVLMQKMEAFIYVMEVSLGADKGSLSKLIEAMDN